MPVDSVAVFVEPDISCAPEIRYTADLLLSTLGARHRFTSSLEESAAYGVTLAYVTRPEEAIFAGRRTLAICANPAAQAFFAGSLPVPAGPHGTILHRGYLLPDLFGSGQASDAEGWLSTAKSSGSVVIPADFLASAFWFLSRWEEARNPIRDPWMRFRYLDSLFSQSDRCTVTTVDQYLALLSDLVHNTLESSGRRPWWLPAWPNGAPFAFCPTHDIDSLRKWHPRRILGEVGRLRQAGRVAGLAGVAHRARRVIQEVVHNPNPHDNVRQLAAREQELGVAVTYFFLAGQRHALDATYDLTRDDSVARLIDQVRSLGHEAGLHGSFTTLDDAGLLSDELETLKRAAGEVVGQRQHFLRFDTLVSWPAYAALGLEYDSSLGFADQVGSRAGFSFPFFPFDVNRRRAFPFIEIPLQVMDATLQSYLHLEAEAAWPVMEQVLAHVADTRGCCSILWHNVAFDELDMPGFGELYWRAVDWAKSRGAWIAPMSDVARWWAKRSLEAGGAWNVPAAGE